MKYHKSVYDGYNIMAENGDPSCTPHFTLNVILNVQTFSAILGIKQFW